MKIIPRVLKMDKSSPYRFDLSMVYAWYITKLFDKVSEMRCRTWLRYMNENEQRKYVRKQGQNLIGTGEMFLRSF